MTLSTEQQNGRMFVSFIQFIKGVADDIKKHPECNSVIIYYDISGIDDEYIHQASVKSSMLLSTLVGHVCIVRFSMPTDEHKACDAVLFHDPAIKGTLSMGKDGKVVIDDKCARA